MHNELLDAFPLWQWLLATGCLLWLAMEGGYRAGLWRRAHVPDEREQPVGAIVGAILGLLALVLGFTFNMAATRFEARRQVLLEDANAIGTTYLRASLLPDPHRTEVERLLREYVDVRIQAVEKERLAEALAHSEALHKRLWEQARAAAEINQESILTGVFIQSLNEMIDLHAKRVLIALRSRVPLVIWLSLLFLSVLGMTAVGYQVALTRSHRSPAMMVLILAFTFVLFLIADLDRSQDGLLRVSQQAMFDLQRSIQSDEAPNATVRP
jgi:hypothetical protein